MQLNKLISNHIQRRRIANAIGTLCAALGILLLGACEQKPKKEEDFTASVAGFNHTDVEINSFYVNGSMIANIRKMGGGGKISCCAILPRHYHPGITVHVEWDASNTEEPHWYKQDVPVEPYPSVEGNLYIHFLPEGKVRAIYSEIGPFAKDYPGPVPPDGEVELPHLPNSAQ